MVKIIDLTDHFTFQRNGFFIEAGALDGETGSNTLSLERDLGWSGLLAEGDPSNVERVKYEKIEMKTQHYMVTGANHFKLLFCKVKKQKKPSPSTLFVSVKTDHACYLQTSLQRGQGHDQ